MTPAVGRARVLELHRQLDLARTGRELLDQKREAMLRAINERLPRVRRLRGAATEALAAARQMLADATCEVGSAAVAGAALAQPTFDGVMASQETVLGVTVPRIVPPRRAFVPCYGPASGTTRLDASGRQYLELMPALLELGCEEAALRRLRKALARTVRRLNALDAIVLPDLALAIRFATAALEEEERDEAVRRARWVALRSRHETGYAAAPRGAVSDVR